jgi:hypothetical protein
MRDIARRHLDSRPDQHVAALNYAILALVDELLWLPSASVAAAAVRLLYGPGAALPSRLLAEAGTGAPPSLAARVASRALLGALLPARMGPASVWRAGAVGLREARALSRERYRELQSAFVSGTARTAADTASLVREVYGVGGRRSCADGARRVLRRVVRLNRATLALLAAVARGESWIALDALGPLPARPWDLPGAALDVLAEALPPIAMPDFTDLAAGLPPEEPVFGDEESVQRYRSLFAEMLSRAGLLEVPS